MAFKMRKGTRKKVLKRVHAKGAKNGVSRLRKGRPLVPKSRRSDKEPTYTVSDTGKVKVRGNLKALKKFEEALEKEEPKKALKAVPKKRAKEVDTSLLSGTFEKKLPVRLTDLEVENKYARTTQIHLLIRVQEAKAKEATKDMREKIRALKKEEDDLQDQLASGEEDRMVQCVNKKDYRRDVVETIRQDAEEGWNEEANKNDGVIESRRMTSSERQEVFPAVKLPPGGRAGQKKRGEEVKEALADEAGKEVETGKICTCDHVEDEHGDDQEFPGSTKCNVTGCDCVAFEAAGVEVPEEESDDVRGKGADAYSVQ